MTAIDCSSRLVRRSINQLRKSNVETVGRYLNHHDPGRALDVAELAAIRNAGLKLFSIWQTGSAKCRYFTKNQGRQDAQNAGRIARKIGQPPGTPIFFKVDYDALPADHLIIADYFQTIKSTIQGYTVGVFGSHAIVELLASMQHADFFYQTSSWSAGKISLNTHIYHYQDGRMGSGIKVGRVRILKPGAIWHPQLEQSIIKLEINRMNVIGESLENTYETGSSYDGLLNNGSNSGPIIKQNRMQNDASVSKRYPGILIKLGSKGKYVRRIQLALGIKTDGFYGSETLSAVETYQRRHRLYPDGIVGPLTWRLLL